MDPADYRFRQFLELKLLDFHPQGQITPVLQHDGIAEHQRGPPLVVQFQDMHIVEEVDIGPVLFCSGNCTGRGALS